MTWKSINSKLDIEDVFKAFSIEWETPACPAPLPGGRDLPSARPRGSQSECLEGLSSAQTSSIYDITTPADDATLALATGTIHLSPLDTLTSIRPLQHYNITLTDWRPGDASRSRHWTVQKRIPDHVQDIRLDTGHFFCVFGRGGLGGPYLPSPGVSLPPRWSPLFLRLYVSLRLAIIDRCFPANFIRVWF